MTVPAHAGAVLTIDLGAVVANWRRLQERLTPGATCAAVVKADAYGCGAMPVSAALAAAGCRTFFVAHVDEGIALRPHLPESEIHILNGLLPGSEGDFAAHRLVPVLNSLAEVRAWADFCRRRGTALSADIHVDTGMSRLGLPAHEAGWLKDKAEVLADFAPRYLLSHLACAEEADHPMNGRQLTAFRAAREILPGWQASLANSSGIFLGPAYHFDLARPGAALYGVNPCPGAPNLMTQVVRLQGKILQVRDVDSPGTVGYGATHQVTGPARIATVAVGYADGYLRSLSNRGCGHVGDIRVPVVGRVSMDLITLDVTAVPPAVLRPGGFVDLIGPRNTVDDIAADAGTIGYEILTALGRRYHRVYLGGAE
jgi:alanine racemase